MTDSNTNRTLWERVKEECYVMADRYETIEFDSPKYFKDIYKTQDEVDKMTDEEIELLNTQVRAWTSKARRFLTDKLYRHCSFLEYAYQRYKELRREKIDKHPMWRSRGAVELVCMETGLKIMSFTTGFKVTLGDTAKDLLSLVLEFDKQGTLQISLWSRVYSRTKKYTPEELEELVEKRRQERNKRVAECFDNNYQKLGLKKNDNHKTYETQEAYYTMLGLEIRKKTMPILMEVKHKNPDRAKDDGTYNVSVRLFKSMKLVRTSK